ncbi:hypothetical protein AB0C51_16145 [Streptomyces pathocidini]|uniref:hypothetical protein n=1 Tax=Streptomyces pathocidini TaxID=1650571 RepID=UPI0033FE4D0A
MDGAVCFVESPDALSLESLLVSCGRLSQRSWNLALREAGADKRVGQYLVEQRWLGQGELELSHLVTLINAAFFVLPLLSDSARFVPGATHWLGLVRAVDAGALYRAIERRRARLDQLRARTPPPTPLKCPDARPALIPLPHRRPGKALHENPATAARARSKVLGHAFLPAHVEFTYPDTAMLIRLRRALEARL